MWEKFKKQPRAKEHPQGLIYAFHDFFKSEVEKIISDEDGILSKDKVDIRISHITFAFNNVHLIRLLQKRG